MNLNKLFKGAVKRQIAKIKKLLWDMGRDAVLVVLLVVLIEAAFGEFLFYKYGFLAQQQEPKISSDSFQFKEGAYQNILSEWQERSQKFQDYSQNNYLSPF
jgi:hypothetical protein